MATYSGFSGGFSGSHNVQTKNMTCRDASEFGKGFNYGGQGTLGKQGTTVMANIEQTLRRGRDEPEPADAGKEQKLIFKPHEIPNRM